MINDLLLAIILGVVEGLTEFVPVSSTGHLILVSRFLKQDSDRIDLFLIFIQFGAILAAFFYYYEKFSNIISSIYKFLKCPTSLKLFIANYKTEKTFSNIKSFILLSVACLPAMLVGFLFHDLIKEKLFSVYTVSLALIVGGLLLIFLDLIKPKKNLDQLSLKDSFIIGMAQIFSLWPGFSRSGSALIGAMLLGYNKKSAADFAFMLGVPMISIAAMYDLLKNISILNIQDLPLFITGFIVSLVVSWFAIKFFIGFLGKVGLKYFGFYRVIIGIMLIFFSF